MTDSVETTRCSNCKRDILSTNFVIHDVHCQRNIYLCPKCNLPVNHEKRVEHDEANHTLVFCTSCHTQVEKYLLNIHLKNTCSQRKVKCQICDIEVGICDIVEHEKYCGARTEKCAECGVYVMLIYKQLHIDSHHTFIKFSDEPGPSPSWQNGRRTLGNFLPDLKSGLYNENSSHQKKKLGRSDHGRRRAKGSPELTEKHRNDDKTQELTSRNGRIPIGAADREIECSRTLENSTSDRDKDANEINSVGVIHDTNAASSRGKESPRRRSSPAPKPKHSETFRQQKERVDITGGGKSAEEESSVGLAVHLSEQLKRDFHLDKDELIAQAIEENAVVLSEFSLFDKSKVSSDKNLSKNVYSGKKQSKNTLHYRIDSYDDDDDDDDDFLFYAKIPGKEVDDTYLPCQFCNSLYPSQALMLHQKECRLNRSLKVLGKTKNQRKKSSASDDKDQVKACGICDRLIPLSKYDSHQLLIHSSSTKN